VSKCKGKLIRVRAGVIPGIAVTLVMFFRTSNSNWLRVLLPFVPNLISSLQSRAENVRLLDRGCITGNLDMTSCFADGSGPSHNALSMPYTSGALRAATSRAIRAPQKKAPHSEQIAGG
jgi:hypothetical protein